MKSESRSRIAADTTIFRGGGIAVESQFFFGARSEMLVGEFARFMVVGGGKGRKFRVTQPLSVEIGRLGREDLFWED